MKRLLSIAMLLITLLCATTDKVAAQEKGDWGIGLRNSLYTHTGHGAKYGVGVFARYNFIDGLRIEPSVSVVCGNGCSVDISADVHYTICLSKTYRNMWLYPIVGVGVNEINRWSMSVNLGVGYDWDITHNWIFSAMVRYMIQTANHAYLRNPIVPQINVSYRF